MTAESNQHADESTPQKKSCCHMSGSEFFQGLIWWAMLTVAVLAVPAVAFAVMLAIPAGNTMQMIIFAVTCWVCTWLGMWLMKKAK